MRTIMHLTSSTCFGGPERQMLGLADVLRGEEYQTVFLLFAEGGGHRAFLDILRREGHDAAVLAADTPRFRRAIREIAGHLDRVKADVLCCHGYKADLLGRPAARRCGVPAVAVSRGWTGENFKIRLYERLDRLALRWMDRVVCVSEGQAVKVRRAGVAPERVTVIHNAIRADRFASPRPEARDELRRFFANPPRAIVGAAGRLSPEKGFGVLARAAAEVCDRQGDVGFVLFGEGPQRAAIQAEIVRAGLGERFVLAGFRPDLDALVPHLDLVVLPSFTEGLPNVVLEAFAAAVPVVATAVGGTPEVIDDGHSGYLVPPGDPAVLAAAVLRAVNSPLRRTMGERGRVRVLRDFTFAAQARAYRRLFERLAPSARGHLTLEPMAGMRTAS